MDEHQAVTSLTTTKGRFNWVLSAAGIPYPPRDVPQVGAGKGSSADGKRKRKRGTGGRESAKSFCQKGLLPVSISPGSSSSAASAPPVPLWSAGRRPPNAALRSLMMHDLLTDPLPPPEKKQKKTAKKPLIPRVEVSSVTSTLLCYDFLFFYSFLSNFTCFAYASQWKRTPPLLLLRPRLVP